MKYSIDGRFLLVALCVLAILGMGVWWCNRSSVRPVQVVIGIDTSGSARPLLSRFVLEASRLTAHLEPDVDLLTLYRVDETTQEFYRDRVHGGREASMRRLLAGVEEHPAHSSTLPERFWAEALHGSYRHKGYLFLVYFSDGDNDDMEGSSPVALKRLATEMAGRPELIAVAIIGVTPANRAYWNGCFGEALGDRLMLVGWDEPSVDSLLDRLDHLDRGK